MTNAAAVILVHNHLSGNLGVSDADRSVTSNVQDALKLVDIEHLNHLILNKNEGCDIINIILFSFNQG